MVLVLSERDINNLLDVGDIIDGVEASLVDRANGVVWSPSKVRFDTNDGRGYMRVLAGGLPKFGAAGLKTYLDPTGKGSGGTVVYILYDMNNGSLRAILAAERLGQLRTAASSAVAAKYLARKDSKTVAILGSGNQAGPHLEAICKVRKITSARVYSLTAAHREEFARRMSKQLGFDVLPQHDPNDAVREVDIVAAVTTAREPVFSGEILDDGVFVTSIGSHLPTIREVDDTTVRRSRIVVDSKEQALQNVGNIIQPISRGIIKPEHIVELGDIITGAIPGRVSESEIFLYHGTGLSIYDVVAAQKAYEKALRQNVGSEVPFESI